MIRLNQMNELELEQFERRICKGLYYKGVRVAYAEGNFGDEVNHTPIGKMMWDLHEKGIVNLVQRKIGFEKFQYEAVVR